MKNYTHHKYNGFTLIELSIVLVIIGLIVGSVLVGRDLIKAAEIRMTVAQIEKYKTAVNTFKIKYGCIPGDCKNAVTLGLGTAGGPGDNGDGDGLVEGSLTAGTAESFNFWSHLSKANLIDGNLLGYPGNATQLVKPSDIAPFLPLTKLGGYIWVSKFAETVKNNFFIIDHIVTTPSLAPGDGGSYYGQQTPYENYAIDSKLDDGMPDSGNIRSYGTEVEDGLSDFIDPIHNYMATIIAASEGPGGATSDFCATNATPPTYNIANTSRSPNSLCILQIKGDF